MCVMQVGKAMFPLNLYPTHDEIKEMHKKYAKSRNRVNLAEFITMVGWLVCQSALLGWMRHVALCKACRCVCGGIGKTMARRHARRSFFF